MLLGELTTDDRAAAVVIKAASEACGGFDILVDNAGGTVSPAIQAGELR